MSKWVYTFGDGKAEGDASMRNLLGGKGANLAEMNKVGLPVPPGFTVTTEVCTYYYDHKKTYPKELWEEKIKDNINYLLLLRALLEDDNMMDQVKKPTKERVRLTEGKKE